jgi:hypothetical protein
LRESCGSETQAEGWEQEPPPLGIYLFHSGAIVVVPE